MGRYRRDERPGKYRRGSSQGEERIERSQMQEIETHAPHSEGTNPKSAVDAGSHQSKPCSSCAMACSGEACHCAGGAWLRLMGTGIYRSHAPPAQWHASPEHA